MGVIPNEEKWHEITVQDDNSNGRLVLVKGGKRAYLWSKSTTHADGGVITVSGPKTLKKLAKAILKEVG